MNMIAVMPTRNVGYVARISTGQDLRGKTIVVPGIVNQFMHWAGGRILAVMTSKVLGKRWRAARENRSDLGPVVFTPKVT
jgi:hypothetical protein